MDDLECAKTAQTTCPKGVVSLWKTVTHLRVCRELAGVRRAE